MITPEDEYARNRTMDGNVVLSKSEQAFYTWYVQNNQEAKKSELAMTDMDAFDDLYPKSEIIADKNWVQKEKLKDNQKDFTRRAEIAEHITKTFADGSEWFGENSFVTKTNEFDDRTHHADGVVTWFDEKQNDMAQLAFDVTISSNSEVLQQKEDYVREDVHKGRLTTIDYFDSQNADKYSLKQVPRVVIMLTPENIIAMCNKAVESVSSKEGEFDSLANDPSIDSVIKNIYRKQLEQQKETLHGIIPIAEKGKKNLNKQY